MIAINIVLNISAEDATDGILVTWAGNPMLYNAVTTQSCGVAAAAAFTESTPADAA